MIHVENVFISDWMVRRGTETMLKKKRLMVLHFLDILGYLEIRWLGNFNPHAETQKKTSYCDSFGISIREKKLSSLKIIIQVENRTATTFCTYVLHLLFCANKQVCINWMCVCVYLRSLCVNAGASLQHCLVSGSSMQLSTWTGWDRSSRPSWCPTRICTRTRYNHQSFEKYLHVWWRSVTTKECLCTWNGRAANKVCVGEIESGVAPEIGMN